MLVYLSDNPHTSFFKQNDCGWSFIIDFILESTPVHKNALFFNKLHYALLHYLQRGHLDTMYSGNTFFPDLPAGAVRV